MGLHRDIFRIAIPAIVSNITVPLLGLCDTTIAGHLGSETFLGAIAVGTMMVNAVFFCLGFLRMGTTGLTAQAYGAGDDNGVRELFSRAAVLGFLLGAVMIILQWPLARGLSLIIGAQGDVGSFATQYFSIVVWGAPAMLATMAISGWILGMQSSFYPMLIAIGTNILNIAASICFVFGLKMGFIGTAAGTLTANWGGLILALFLVRKFNHGRLPFTSWRDAIRLTGSGRFFKVNSYIFLRSFCLMAVTVGVTAIGARLGTLTLAVNAVMMQFFTFYSYFMDGFAFSGEALVGRSAGAHDIPALRRVIRSLLVIGGVVAILTAAIYGLLQDPISGFITNETTVLTAINKMRIILIILPLVSVGAFIYDGIFIGLAATRQMLYATAIGGAAFFLINMIFPSANITLWAAFLTYLLLRGITLAIATPQSLRKIA